MKERKRERASFAVAYAPALGGGCGGGGDDIGACLTREGAEESLQQNFALMENAHARERAEDNAGVVRGGGEGGEK